MQSSASPATGPEPGERLTSSNTVGGSAGTKIRCQEVRVGSKSDDVQAGFLVAPSRLSGALGVPEICAKCAMAGATFLARQPLVLPASVLA